MSTLPTTNRRTYPPVLLAVFVLLWVASCLYPPYPQDLVLQHIPTAVVVAMLVATSRRWPLSNVSYTCVFLFMLLHLLGARYLYTYVPYDDWAQRLLGTSVNEFFGFHRNHYDRLVHFGFGLLLVYPARELRMRQLGVSGANSYLLGVELVVIVSVLYELGEWLVALLLAPEYADRYNGQQGDIWDAHKDMALALAGAVIGAAVIAFWSGRAQKTHEPLSC